MSATSKASAAWQGNLFEGAGTVSLDSSGSGTFDVNWKARTEGSDTVTTPEELIAAAHSACFSMAFSNLLAQNGTTPESVNTEARVTFVAGTGITGSHLTVHAIVPGLDQAKFAEIAEAAKLNCPVSKALAAIEITLDATLG